MNTTKQKSPTCYFGPMKYLPHEDGHFKILDDGSTVFILPTPPLLQIPEDCIITYAQMLHRLLLVHHPAVNVTETYLRTLKIPIEDLLEANPAEELLPRLLATRN